MSLKNAEDKSVKAGKVSIKYVGRLEAGVFCPVTGGDGVFPKGKAVAVDAELAAKLLKQGDFEEVS